MLQEASEQSFRNSLDNWIAEQVMPELFRINSVRQVRLTNDCFNRIKIQLLALGLIQKSEKPRSVKDAGTYWSLSAYGDQVLTNLLAARKTS